MQTNLFGDIEPTPVPTSGNVAGPFAAVAIERSIDRCLDYSIPPKLISPLKVGQRVAVPLGSKNKRAFGFVVSIHDQTEYQRIKPLFHIDDERVLVSAKMLELARWMSRYYCAPLGVVLETILPSAVRKKVGLGYRQMVRLAKTREDIQALLEKTRAPKRRAILARLLQLEPEEAVELFHLANEAGASAPTVRKLKRMGLISIEHVPDLPGMSAAMAPSPASDEQIALNDEQRAIYEGLLPKIRDSKFSVNLVLGVTGSGKTEVYLHCIREVVKAGRRAIVMVPEIALTPQTVRRFTGRFPNVAVLHSGLTATERHRFWQQVATGDAQVVIGARSAVFAPVPDLGVIVVDEEHEASYKQDTAPRYHGRDIAIKRAQLENVPVILGSATPSLESYYRVGARAAAAGGTESPGRATGVYEMYRLPHRVRGLPMPHVELIDMKQESRFRRGIHLLSQRLENLLRTTIDAGHQAILLLNRRGYSNFVYCSSCQNPLKCKFCDTTMTYHRSAAAEARNSTAIAGVHKGQLHCHYCLAVNPLPVACPDCGKKLTLFGLGTQRVEEELAHKFPDIRFARVDSDSMRDVKDYEALLDRFAKREIHVMLGTQMIAKGLDYPNVTLVGVISGDTALSLPDFRSGERTFQLITQVAGRAGRGDHPGRVVLQTFQPDDPTIQFAIKQDYIGFAQTELVHRRDTNLPPMSRMARIVIRDEDENKLAQSCAEIAAAISQAIDALGGKVQMKGPSPCAINKIAGYMRAQVVLTASAPSALQEVLMAVRQNKALSRNKRAAIDVDPVSLL